MAWQNEMVIIVRHMINDLDPSNYEFQDSRLEESILVSAQNIKSELDFYNTYSVEVDKRLLTPDPTLTATNISNKDDDFIALCCLKTAIMVTNGQLKYYAMRAISIKDGPTSLDVKGIISGLKMVLEDLTKQYEQAKLDYQTCRAGFGKAILSPYSPGSFAWNNSYMDRRAGYFM